MNSIEKFLQNSNLRDADNIDSLLELASLLRELIRDQQYEGICSIINYTLAYRCHEAFSWCMETLQETLEQDADGLINFECIIGKSIPDYDAFLERLHVDLKSYINGFKTVCDHNGEVESFFNILTYETRYKNIHLVSSENFDTKDNDFVQYKLTFTVS